MLIRTFKINFKFVIILLIIAVLITSIFLFSSMAKSDEKDEKKDFIKWVDFNVSNEALRLTAKLDIKSHNENQEIKYNWIELLAYLACQNGGNFKNFKKTDLDTLVNKIKNGESIENLTQNLKLYNLLYFLILFVIIL